MNPLHLILVALMGLVALSMAAVPHQLVGGHIANIDSDDNGNRTLGEELAAHASLPRALSGMLLDWVIKCDTDPNTDPPPGMKQGKLLSDNYCRQWLKCKADGTKYQAREPAPEWDPATVAHGQANVKWCKDHCECVLLDVPAKHYNWNMGCQNTGGTPNYIPGNFGSVSRDTESAGPLGNDGLAMEAFDGPPRKE